MYKAKCNGDEGIFKGIGKNIGDNPCPIGYEVTEVYFVDNSGFGSESEPALTAGNFLNKVKANFYYAITGIGQFQVYVTEYRKVNRSRKQIYKDLGITKSKLVKNNTRLTEFADGRRTLRLHNTDIITWKPDGKIVLNSGGYRTHTTKARINEFLRPHGIGVYQKNYKWYLSLPCNGEIVEFTDGIELTA